VNEERLDSDAAIDIYHYVCYLRFGGKRLFYDFLHSQQLLFEIFNSNGLIKSQHRFLADVAYNK
jgi:hypothetical protein